MVLNHPRIHEVTGDPSAGDAAAFDCIRCGTCLGHVEIMVVMLDAVEDRLFVQRVFDALLCARVVKTIFEIGIRIQFQCIRPQVRGDAFHFLRVVFPQVDVIHKMRRGLSLPYKGDTVAFDDGVPVHAGELEEV